MSLLLIVHDSSEMPIVKSCYMRIYIVGDYLFGAGIAGRR
jgi:hypothetical protein